MGNRPEVAEKSETGVDVRKLSYTQFSMWSTCAYQWKLTYVDKLKPKESSIELIFGTSMHDTIQTWLTILYNDGQDKADAMDQPAFFKNRFLELFKENVRLNEETQENIYLCDKATLKEYYEDGCAILDYLKENQQTYFPTKHHKLIGIELELSIPLREWLRFTGFIDIMIYNEEDEMLTIIDLKTSKSGWSHWQKGDDKKLNQILLYKKFYSEQFEVPMKNISTEFIILSRKTKGNRIERFIPQNDKRSVMTAGLKFEHFIKTTFADDGTVKVGNLVPTPSKSNCLFCPFKDKPDLCGVSYYHGK